MGRIKEAKVFFSDSVEVTLRDHVVVVSGDRGILSFCFHDLLSCKMENGALVFTCSSKRGKKQGKELLGTTCSLIRSMLFGTTVGFTKKLQLVGVGYRAMIKDHIISLIAGFSHVIDYQCPSEVNVDCPTPVDIIIHGMNKQIVGQVAADLRAIHPPEPFSGKGVRYLDEVLRIKEVKKK